MRAYLVDLQRRIVLWHYQVPFTAQQVPATMLGETLCYALAQTVPFGGNQRGLYFTALPHAEAQRIAAGLTEDQLLAIKPGISVSLDLRVPATNPHEAQQLATSLTQRLKANGITVAGPGAAIVLEATVESGPTQTVQYETRFGPGRETQTANVTEKTSRLAFKEGGRLLWQRTATYGAPFSVQIREGQSLDAAIQAQQPSQLQFFLNAPLPAYLARHGDKLVYGTSALGPQGPVDVKEP